MLQIFLAGVKEPGPCLVGAACLNYPSANGLLFSVPKSWQAHCFRTSFPPLPHASATLREEIRQRNQELVKVLFVLKGNRREAEQKRHHQSRVCAEWL